MQVSRSKCKKKNENKEINLEYIKENQKNREKITEHCHTEILKTQYLP